MARICPILNHPLNDGVLVEDEALVKFIQKRNLDFLATELVCRWCKQEIIKLYNKKLQKAIELRKTSLSDGSISSLKTSKTSTTSGSNNISYLQANGNKTNSSVQDDGNTNSTSNNVPENHIEQVANQKTIPAEYGNKSNVTIRKKTIKDYLTAKEQPQTTVISTARENFKEKSLTAVSANSISPNICNSGMDNEDVIRRNSQEPTTSNAVNTKKRRILESDSDDGVSLNAVNNRLPHIQPIPPKRKPTPDRQNSLARDIMNEYIKNITGG